jgi:SAM-dependent methyltransferase
MPITNSSAIPLRPDLRVVAGLVPPAARVLDLGCGDGALLEHLKIEKGVQGRGIERSETGVLACVRRGLSVRQGNLQEGLADYPDKSFDVVILSQTLQFLNDPMMILGEMLRVGRLAVVSFPTGATGAAGSSYWPKAGFHPRPITRKPGTIRRAVSTLPWPISWAFAASATLRCGKTCTCLANVISSAGPTCARERLSLPWSDPK